MTAHELARLMIDGPRADIVLDHGKVNTLTSRLLDELLDLVSRVADHPEVRVLVVKGAGTAFSAGADLATVAAGLTTNQADQLADLQRQGGIVELLRTMDKVTLAAIDGPCAGAGLSLALACDIRVATARTRFRVAFATSGMSGDLGASWTLPRLLGEARARDLFLRDPKFSAVEALGWGIVSEVVDDASFTACVDDLASRLSALAPLAVRGIKQNLAEAMTSDLALHLQRESARHLTAAHATSASAAAARFLTPSES